MKFPSSIQCMDNHIFEKKKEKKAQINSKQIFICRNWNIIIVNMANEYDCDMYNMCNQMYSQMYLTTIQDINCKFWRCLLIHLWQI